MALGFRVQGLQRGLGGGSGFRVQLQHWDSASLSSIWLSLGFRVWGLGGLGYFSSSSAERAERSATLGYVHGP